MTKREQSAAVVGDEATELVYRGNAWLLRLALTVVPTAPHRRLAAESEKTEKKATADLRNQQWLYRTQERWEEYRRQYPQNPEQGG